MGGRTVPSADCTSLSDGWNPTGEGRMTLPDPRTEEAVDFLVRYSGSHPIVLTAIIPDGGGVKSRPSGPPKSRSASANGSTRAKAGQMCISRLIQRSTRLTDVA